MSEKTSGRWESSVLRCFSFLFLPSLLCKRTKVVEEAAFDALSTDDASSWLSGGDFSQSVYYDTSASKVTSKIQALPSFSHLVRQSQYVTILKILNKESVNTLRVWLHIHDSYTIQDATTEATEYSSLHAALGTSLCMHCMFANITSQRSKLPPPEFLQALLDRLMDVYDNVPEDVTDPQGYTPLHIWIIQKLYLQIGCDAGALTRLLAVTSAPLMQDVMHQRCPLHWLCWNGPPPSSNQRENSSSKICPRIETLRILLDAYPEATLMCDVDGRTPVDLALNYPWDTTFLSMIQLVADKVLRNRQNHNPRFFASAVVKVDQEEAVDSMAKSMDSSAGYFLQNGIPYKIRLLRNCSKKESERAKQSPAPMNVKKTGKSKNTRAKERAQRWREFMDLDGDSTCASCLENDTILSYGEAPPLAKDRCLTASSQKSAETYSTTPVSDNSGNRNDYEQMEC
jgi:hypothetical protein